MRTSLASYFAGRGFLVVMALCVGVALTIPAAFAQPITTDSRIKTFVYNPNEVFAITTHYGYQSNIEFGPKEQIDTISVGDRVAWQIIPAGNRLFIRAMEENVRTNMTVVTNLRAYQFDLRSSTAEAVFGSAELTYVVRFFYPPANSLGSTSYVPPVANHTYLPPVIMNAPASNFPQVAAPTPIQPSGQRSVMNYRYTYSGPNDIAPTKIYDDGKTTYFKLGASQTPQIAVMTARGETIPIAARRTAEGLLAVDAVAPRFSLSQAGRHVIVYNEAGGEV